MNYDDILAIVRHEANGARLSAEEKAQLDEYIASHPDQAPEIAFEKTLAATIAEQPTVAPSVNFVDTVLAKLPSAPIHVPEPSFRSIWQWVAGGVGAGAAASTAAWHWRDTWLGWLGDMAPALAPEPGSMTVGFYSFIGALGIQAPNIMNPAVIVSVMLALGAFAWGAISFADAKR